MLPPFVNSWAIKRGMTVNAIEILFDSARGVYIPQNFADECDLSKFDGIDADDIEVIKQGPDHEWYWEAWNTIENNATYTENGHTWHLYQDGDLFLICYELMTDEENDNFGFIDI